MSSQTPERTRDDRDTASVRLTIPAKPEYVTLCRLALTGLARTRPVEDEVLADLKLALTEAASNSVRHAYGDAGGQVEITYSLMRDRLEIEVVDEGEGFESVEEWRVAHERFFEQPIEPNTLIEAVRFRLVEDG